MTIEDHRKGRLYYLVGPSGAGKDSLLDYVKVRVDPSRVRLPRRYITRSSSAGGEDHLAISVEDFEQKMEAGFFALWWHSHGNYYGLSTEIDDWLANGIHVLLNGSRGYMPTALANYPNMVTVLVQVSDAILRQRLESRGRESSEQIDQRIERNREFTGFTTPNLVRLNNDRPLSESGQELLEIVSTGRLL